MAGRRAGSGWFMCRGAAVRCCSSPEKKDEGWGVSVQVDFTVVSRGEGWSLLELARREKDVDAGFREREAKFPPPFCRLHGCYL